MMKTLLLLLFMQSLSISAQNLPDFQPLESKGDIPLELRIPTTVKIEREISKIPYNISMSEKRIRQDFATMSNFSIDALLLSGKILFNEDVSNYVTQIGRRILQNETKAFRDSIKFFVLRSDLTNAFATNQGIVFVTLGLISQLQTEAELAFVLAHEIGHIKRKHVINNYVKSKNYYKDKKSQYYTQDNTILELSRYSQQAEIEADSMAFEYLKNMPYSSKAMMSVFDVLQYSYLPLDEVNYDLTYLEDDNYQLSDRIKKDTMIAISFNEDYDDSKSTHPNIKKRREYLQKYADKIGLNFETKQDFISPEGDFKQIQKLSRFETIRINLKDKDYIKALYNIQVLEQKHSNSLFLTKAKIKALYGLSKYKTQHKYFRLNDGWNTYEGRISSLYRSMEDLKKEEMHFLTLNYAYNQNKTLKDNHIKKLVRDLVWDLEEEYDWTYETLLAKMEELSQPVVVALKDSAIVLEDTTEKSIDFNKLTKYEKIRLQQGKNKKATKESGESTDKIPTYLLLLKDEMSDSSFTNMFKDIEERYIVWDAQNDSLRSNYEAMSYRQKNKHNKKLKITDLHENIEDVLIVDPFYYKIDDKKGLKMSSSEEAKIEFNDHIMSIAEKAGIDAQMLSSKNLNTTDIEEYNDMARLYDWIGERLSHDDIYFIPSEQEYVSILEEKYNTRNVMFTGIMSFKQRRENASIYLIYGIIAYPLFPFALMYALSAEHHTYFYNLTLDVRTGNIKINHTEELKTKPNEGFIKSIMYDHFLHIQKEKKN